MEQIVSTFTFEDAAGKLVAAKRHTNPDGSIGGWVAVNADVSKDAIIEAGALVEPGARVMPGAHVRAGQFVEAAKPS